MNTTIIVNQVIILFIFQVVGFISRKTDIINKEINKKLSELLLKVVNPALIFSSFIMKYQKEKMINALTIIGLATGMFLFVIIVSLKVLFRNKKSKRVPILRTAFVFSNCGFMGIPVINGLIGQEGVFYASMYVAVFQFFLWTYGVMVFTEKYEISTAKAVLKSPALISVFIGSLVFIMQIPIPGAIKSAAKMLGGMTTPIAMMIIGAIMAEVNIRAILKDSLVYIISFIRLFIMPFLAIITVLIIPVPHLVGKIFVLLLAMPIAVNIAVFAEKYDKDVIFASKIVSVSTLFSIITIPLILLFLEMFL